MKLYYHPLSDPARAILHLLQESGVSFEAYQPDMANGEHKSEKFLAMNPEGKVPCLEVDGHHLNESAALLRFVAASHASLQRYYSGDLIRKQKIDSVLDYNACTFRPPFEAFFHVTMDKAMSGQESFTEEQKKSLLEAQKTMVGNLEFLEARFRRQRSKFLVDNEPTIADIQLFNQFLSFELIGFKNHAAYPLIVAWTEECKKDPVMKRGFQMFKEVMPTYQPVFGLPAWVEM